MAAADSLPAGPTRELFIYYLEGCPTPENTVFDATFIGNWQEDGFSFLFFSHPARDQVENLLQRQPGLTLIDHYHMTYEEWHGCRIAPYQTDLFLITPPWKAGEPDSAPADGRMRIILDPGVVFGTGTHPTTRDCLAALELAGRMNALGTLLDLGTGTGLLALAGARLGCRKVLAVDFNYLAVRTAAANIRRNRLAHRVLAVQGRAENFMDISADLVIANIHYDVMKTLIAADGFLNKKWFILSGLLRSQARMVSDLLAQYPVRIIRRWDHDGIWHTFFGQTDKVTTC